jgi:putative Mn2+ efflux pump MntP
MGNDSFTWITFLVAFALAIDAFSVSIGAGAYFRKTSKRQKFRLSFHFGLFQFVMPILGWFAGKQIVGIVENYDHWIAFVILCLLGGKMLLESRKTKPITEDITRGWKLIGLSVATSLDALAVGFSVSFLVRQIFAMSIVIGLVASGMTLLGIFLGERLSFHFGRWAGSFAGAILILIGMQIVLHHLEVI